ncbi:MAG TPA: hypothetical protein VEX64_02620 [Pyrinomonadaceae bacterium]|jgi:hypothetical protein|nr:hypothetical protein [Pyrinomonadaceae bacterium]
MKKTFYCFLLCLTLLTACGGSAQKGAPGNQTEATVSPTPTPPQTPLEKELTYVGRSNFRQIFVFSRKDGEKLRREDIDYFKQYAPTEQINQRLKTSDEMFLVAGTNFPFLPEQTEALQKRFKIEDFTEKYGRK